MIRYEGMLSPVYRALLLILSVLIGVGGYFAYQEYTTPYVASYEQCVRSKGSVIQESYPATCITPNGKRFIQPVSNSPSEQPTQETYSCPENGWEDCMPMLDSKQQRECTKEALDWKQEHCPDFQGAAL